MSILSPVAAQPFAGLASLRRFSVAEYHKMILADILNEEDKVELLDGFVVLKMPRNPPHDNAIELGQDQLLANVPAGWRVRVQSAVTLSRSEPEPDLLVRRGGKRATGARHPGPTDIGLVIEVADSSLDRDRNEKGPIYARDGLPIYWIVNLVDQQIEVYSLPQTVGDQPAYTQRRDHHPGDDVPLVLDGVTVATIPVREMLP